MRNGAAPTQDVGMDSLVIQAAHTQSRFVPGMEAVRLATALARRPTRVASRLASLGGEARAIIDGSSERTAPRGDRRFADPAWQQSWLFRRVLQGYLAAEDLTHGLIDDAQLESDVDHRLHFVAGNVLDALAPTNFPWSNPAAMKVAIERGGANFRDGAQALVRDARSPQRIPSNVDRSGFKVGENLACTPGQVVERHEMYELIQYTPTTDEVRAAPLLIVPPMISKFYVVDLSPGKSLVEYLVARGQQVLAISWRNPTAGDAAWDLDAYVTAIIDAMHTARSVTKADRIHLSALCAGGVATSATLGHLAHIGELDQIAGVTLNVTTLDTRRAGTIGNFVSPDTAAAAVKSVQRKGYLDRNQLLRTFAWLRPNDMIWNYWVNNYLMGNKPPAFDLLFWNADTMDMPAGLHHDFVNIGLHNPFLTAGEERILGSPVDLSAGRYRRLHRGRRDRPHHALAQLLRVHAAARRRRALRPFERRPHRGRHQPARQPEGALPRRRRRRARRADLDPRARAGDGHVVGGLGRLAGRAQRRAAARAEEARLTQVPAGCRRARRVRAGLSHPARGHPARGQILQSSTAQVLSGGKSVSHRSNGRKL